VYSGEDYWNGVWQQVFWNSSIERVYVVGRETVPGPLPQRRVGLRRDGRFVLRRGGSVSERFVAAPLDVVMLGDQIAHVDQHDLPDQPGLGLWRVESPVRLGSVLQGVRWNGDMHEAGRLRVYACTGGTLFLTLLQKGSTKADILRDGQLVTTATFGPDGVWNGQVPVEPGPERTCMFEVRPDGFLGSTQFRFVRS
jgi:hypothetical protein